MNEGQVPTGKLWSRNVGSLSGTCPSKQALFVQNTPFPYAADPAKTKAS